MEGDERLVGRDVVVETEFQPRKLRLLGAVFPVAGQVVARFTALEQQIRTSSRRRPKVSAQPWRAQMA